MKEKSPNIRASAKKMFQESAAYRYGGVRLNEAFWYHVSTDKEYPNEIGIHLYPMDVGETLAERKGALGLYKAGLEELARRLETEPKLAHITEVVGYSKIVYKNPKLLELLGFKVSERDEKKKEALATISREKFLKRPWNKAKKEPGV